MQKLNPETHGFQKTESAMRYLSVRLKSRPESRPLAASIETERTKVNTLNNTYQDAYEARQAATAEIGYQDVLLGDSFMQISRHVLTMVKGERSHDLFKRLFPVAPSSMVEMFAGEKQENNVKGVIETINTNDDYEALRPMADALGGLQMRLKEAEGKRQELYRAEGKARNEYIIGLDKAHRVYNLMYHQLTLIFPDDSALVESFFKKLDFAQDNFI